MFKGSVASADLTQVVNALKAAAEPTRLRLLALLGHGELTVGEICSVLGQSQPRISRHLRLLTEQGFLDRFREQQCVYYRVPVSGRSLAWLRQVQALVDPEAQVLRRDRERGLRVVSERARRAGDIGSESDGRCAELRAVLFEELGPVSVGELLDIGTGSGLMLEILGPRAQHAVGVDISTPALRLARTRVHGAGLSHCEFRRGDMYGLPYGNGSFDVVTIERVLATAAQPEVALAEAARTLKADGQLILVEDFDQIGARVGTAAAADAGAAAAATANPLAVLRSWLARAGLAAARLRPVDLHEQHLIVAFARRLAN